MKVILYVATSINGLITKGEDDSDWVTETDWKEFGSLMRDCGIMVMGRRTYEIFGDDFPCEGAVNVVMTSQRKLLGQETSKDVIFTDKTPRDVVKMAEEEGFKKLMLIGGMKLNTSFFEEDLIDEVWLSVHPLLIGNGKMIMDKINYDRKVKLLGIKELDEGLVQLRYEIVK